MDWLTKENTTLAITVFIALWQVGKSVLRTVAGSTKSTTDDSVLAFMDAAEKKLAGVEESQWLKDHGPGIWAQVEALSRTTVPALKGVGKLAYFLGMVHDAYVSATGTGLTSAGTAVAKSLAAGLSAQEKLGNPPAAPGSK
jgi:hypothetical protein